MGLLPEESLSKRGFFCRKPEVDFRSLAQVGTDLERDLCAASPDLSEDDKVAELLPIKVQQLCILSVQDMTEQANEIASEIRTARFVKLQPIYVRFYSYQSSISDASTKLLANLNKLSISGNPENPFLAYRIFHSSPDVPESDRLFSFQKSLVDQNEAVLDLMSFKFKGVKRSTAQRLGQDSAPTTSASINSVSAINAAAHAQKQLGKLGLKSMLPLLEKRPADVGLLLTVVQLYLLTKNHGAAIKVVETVLKRLEESRAPADQDVRFAPGLIAVVVSLHMIEGRRSHVQSELAKAATYWRHRSKPPPALLRFAGLSLLESGVHEDQEKARAIFETLQKEGPADRFSAAGILAASAESKAPGDNEDAQKLTPIDRLTAGVDVAALERAGVAQPASSTPSVLTRKRPAEEAKKPAKKRVRKSRLPKDRDPNKPPDPERWLPLRDRSTYRPKGKKGKQKQAAQTQGTSEKPEVASSAAPEPAKPQIVSGGGGGGDKSKKKKKGKK